MDKIVLVPDSTNPFLTFHCKDRSSCRATSSIRITNKNEYKIGFKLKTTNLNRYIVKPGVGVIQPDQTLEIIIILIYEGTRHKEICEDRMVLCLFDMNSNWEESNLSALMKEYANQVLQMKYKTLCSFQDEAPEQKPSIVPDIREEESGKNSIPAEFKSTLEESQFLPKPSAKPEAHSNELLEQKERVIHSLQEEIRRLENELGILRGRIVNEPAQRAKPSKVEGFETWQLIAVLLIAIFFGYFIASK